MPAIVIMKVHMTVMTEESCAGQATADDSQKSRGKPCHTRPAGNSQKSRGRLCHTRPADDSWKSRGKLCHARPAGNGQKSRGKLRHTDRPATARKVEESYAALAWPAQHSSVITVMCTFITSITGTDFLYFSGIAYVT